MWAQIYDLMSNSSRKLRNNALPITPRLRFLSSFMADNKRVMKETNTLGAEQNLQGELMKYGSLFPVLMALSGPHHTHC